MEFTTDFDKSDPLTTASEQSGNQPSVQAFSKATAIAPALPTPVTPSARLTPATAINEIRSGLGIVARTAPIPTIVLSAAQKEDLKADIVRTWKQHQHCEQALAPLLYKLCAVLHAPGYKDEGFAAWLKTNGIPKATAYRWIDKHAQREGLPLPYKSGQSRKPKPGTSFQVRQTAGEDKKVGSEDLPAADYVAAPESLNEVQSILFRYLDKLDWVDRRSQIEELLASLNKALTSISLDLNQGFVGD